MRGIFRRRIDKVYPVGVGSPILAEREVTKDIDENGITKTVVFVQKSDMSDVIMPEKGEYDLETMLANGYVPEPINVRNLLVDENGEYSAIAAFNSLQEHYIRHFHQQANYVR